MEDSIFQLRGLLFMSSYERLTEVIRKVELDVGGRELNNRVQAIQFIDDWLCKESEGEDGGQQAIQKIRSAFGRPAEELNIEADVTIPSSNEQEVKSEPQKTKERIRFQREFKINGQIDLRNGISFTSLIRQIETGIKKGYPELEVIDGVIRAIPTSSGLRNYLEGRSSLELSTLRAILRSHYREKSATERYNELGGATQGNGEGPSEFLMRTLDMRNKILFSSQESASDLKYDPDLVNGLFIRTVYTGLRDLAIRQEFRTTLETKDVTDEQLIRELNNIVSRENERKNKFTKCGKVAEVSATHGDVNPSSKKPPKEGFLMSEMKALKAEISEIKGMLGKSDAGKQDVCRRAFKKGCPACHDAGTGDNCIHCWRCGSDEHFKKGCRARLQGNGQRLHLGDRL